MTHCAEITFKSDWSNEERQIMSRALQLAKKGQYTARPNPMVGCVLVKNEQIIGEGWHQKSGFAHAEINALKAAGSSAVGSTCYVTLEPCAHTGKTGPCAKALVEAGIKKVIAAMQDPNPQVAGKGFQLLLDAGISVEVGLLAEQASWLNRGFVKRLTENRPFISCKLAMSLDGRTALADGSSKWITSEAARNDVQKLRARQDAIITGIGTVLADDPSLNVRAEEQSWFEDAKKLDFVQPARVLLDKKGQAQTKAKIFNADTEVYWICQSLDNANKQCLDQNVHIILQKNDESLAQLLNNLSQLGFNQVLLEAGHKLAGQFLAQGLIDELIIYVAPKLMGNKAIGLFDFEVKNMLDTPRLKLKDCRNLGDDIRLTYVIDSNSNSTCQSES